ncbi:MAG TPA: NAD-dependent epimerase/dehydratase family protein [Bacteroidia bacterium]|nr:NAD-dependent epimerase/dehydratase family protein [Bacteroidia bacterium]
MILVTGGTGFVGAYLLAELAKEGKPVRALKRPSSSTKYTEELFIYKFGEKGPGLFATIEWVLGDIMEIYTLDEALQGVEDVYHCATEVSLRDEAPDEIILTAEKGTENMVNASLARGVRKFCHVSSVAALGENNVGKEITEEAFEEFVFENSPYAVGKHLAEAQVWRANGEGLNTVVVCPSMIMGAWPGNKGTMSMFKFIAKQSGYYTTGTMGYVDVQDVIMTMLALMNGNHFGERYIISAENISFKDLFTSIAKSIGKPVPKRQLSLITLNIFRFFNNMFSRTKITSTMVDHGNGTYVFGNKKITTTLGYTFRPIKESIEEMGSFFMDEKSKRQ